MKLNESSRFRPSDFKLSTPVIRNGVEPWQNFGAKMHLFTIELIW